jgi:hypothetical protein
VNHKDVSCKDVKWLERVWNASGGKIGFIKARYWS